MKQVREKLGHAMVFDSRKHEQTVPEKIFWKTFLNMQQTCIFALHT